MMEANGLLTELGEHDVLLGRGTGPNAHRGNKAFRAMSSELLKDANSSRSGISKVDLARKLVSMVHSKKGKFVRRLSNEEASTVARTLYNSTDKKFWQKRNIKCLYVVVPEEVAVDKAKQNFRHQLRRLQAGHGEENCVFFETIPKQPASNKRRGRASIEYPATTGGHGDSSCDAELAAALERGSAITKRRGDDTKLIQQTSSHVRVHQRSHQHGIDAARRASPLEVQTLRQHSNEDRCSAVITTRAGFTGLDSLLKAASNGSTSLESRAVPDLSFPHDRLLANGRNELFCQFPSLSTLPLTLPLTLPSASSLDTAVLRLAWQQQKQQQTLRQGDPSSSSLFAPGAGCFQG